MIRAIQLCHLLFPLSLGESSGDSLHGAGEMHTFNSAWLTPGGVDIDQTELADTFDIVSDRACAHVSNRVASEINVVYAGDLRVLDGLMTSILSLWQNLKCVQTCNIHLIIPREEKRHFAKALACIGNQIGASDVTMNFIAHDMIQHLNEELTLPYQWERLENGSFKVAANRTMGMGAVVRLHLPAYLHNTSRVIWLDSDTIVHTDVSELYFKDMLDHPLGAWVATDFNFTILMAEAPDPAASLRDWLLTQDFYLQKPDPRFFNTGILLFDLDKWRSGNLSSKIESWISVTKEAGLVADDQTWLNLQFHWSGHDFLPLEKKWNHNPAQICARAGENVTHAPPAVYHWKGPLKFWQEPYLEFCFYKAYKLRSNCPL